MKKIILYTFALSMLVFASCGEKFLDSKPVTSLTDGNFFQTKNDAELAIVGCYDGLQKIYSNGVAFPVLSIVLSDNCYGGTKHSDDLNYKILDEFDKTVDPGFVDLLNGSWEEYYRAIYRMNSLLVKMDQIDWEGDEAAKNSIEAQAKFMRAYCYFDMVRIWEKVPLLTEPNDGNVPQAEADAIYSQIAEDLLFAAENATEVVEPGRVTKWAAKAMLARVFLFYTGYYSQTSLPSVSGSVSQAQALQAVEDVIASGAYSLISEYKNLWPAAAAYISGTGDGATLETTYAGNDNSETVFAIKYNITSDYDGNADGNHWQVMLGLREQSISPYGRGWGACTVPADFYGSFDAADTRRDASIIGIEEESLDFENASIQRDYTGYITKKYSPMANPDNQLISEANDAVNLMLGNFQDYVVMRYADVLLMASELGSSNTQSYFDQVRTRAGLTSRTASVANILEERRFEFAFEGIRYWDVLRQGLSTAADVISVQTTTLVAGVETPKTISAANITKTRGFQQIPQQQITRSGGVLKQNAGW